MPAWITSLLRDEVTVPIPSAASRMITSRPACASRRATARPITPAPMTTHSTLSISQLGSGLVFYPTRRAPQGVGAFGLNPIPTLSLCLGWSFLQDRLDPFAGVFRAGGLLVKH